MKITFSSIIAVLIVVFVVMSLAVVNEIKTVHSETATLSTKLDQLSSSLDKVVIKQECIEKQLKKLDDIANNLQYKTSDLENRFMGTIEVYQTDLHELHTKLDALHNTAPKKSIKRRCKCR